MHVPPHSLPAGFEAPDGVVDLAGGSLLQLEESTVYMAGGPDGRLLYAPAEGEMPAVDLMGVRLRVIA